MPNIFTITTAAQALKANVNGQATTVFTVTNATSRPIRGFAKIKPLGNTQSEWLKIDGEAERDFPAGGTHQFTVNFNKPKPSTPSNAPQSAESFPFRLDAVSSANPDEDFTEGPVVTVETAEQKVEEKKPFPWWILIVLGILLLVGVIVAFLLLRNRGNKKPDNTTPSPTITATVTPTLPPPPTPKPKVVRMSAKEYGVDRWGSDFSNFYMPTLQQCEDACKETERCKAYTYGRETMCWLKDKIPAPRNDPNFISGTKIEE